jgi:hypothetical protein
MDVSNPLIKSETPNQEQLLLLRSLTNFRMMDFKPLYPIEKYQQSLDAVNLSLVPLHPKALAVQIHDIIKFATNFGKGLENNDMEYVAKTYREALQEVPGDLLREAIAKLKREYKWTHKFPTPADIMEMIQYRLEARRSLRWKLNGILENWKDDTDD